MKQLNVTLKKSTAVAVILLMTLGLGAAVFDANAVAAPDRETGAFISVNPPLIGLTQPLTVNLWCFPSPAGPNFEGVVAAQNVLAGYHNLTITFTRPDGSKDTFMPTHGTADKLGLVAGQTEATGSIWFSYYPNQVGNWTAQFSYPGETYTWGNDTVY
jgi:hypothetical protein